MNRHIAFVIGIHRRIGSNLARMEIAVALEELLVAIPGSISTVRRDGMVGAMVRGPRRLPILFRCENSTPQPAL